MTALKTMTAPEPSTRGASAPAESTELQAPSGILRNLWPAIAITLVIAVITGIIYPLVVTGLAQTLFPVQAGGSLIDKNGQPTTDVNKAAGSLLIGQWFDQPQYFWPRPSGTSVTGSSPSIGLPYNAGQSGGTNLSPTNDAWVAGVKSAVDTLRKADPANSKPIPIDLVTASGSGLDPHISVDAAEYQLSRVASSRKMDPAKVQALIDANTQGRSLGMLGEKAVNVLTLNLALDQAAPYTAPATAPATATATAAVTAETTTAPATTTK
jgi:potassium-transporting ATPase KdpC subunit